jgi:alpha-glucosidase
MERFTASAGMDDETRVPGTAAFQVLGDDDLLYDSGVLRGDQPATPVSVDVSGMRMLTLKVTDGDDGKNHDHADWADARLSCG